MLPIYRTFDENNYLLIGISQNCKISASLKKKPVEKVKPYSNLLQKSSYKIGKGTYLI